MVLVEVVERGARELHLTLLLLVELEDQAYPILSAEPVLPTQVVEVEVFMPIPEPVLEVLEVEEQAVMRGQQELREQPTRVEVEVVVEEPRMQGEQVVRVL